MHHQSPLQTSQTTKGASVQTSALPPSRGWPKTTGLGSRDANWQTRVARKYFKHGKAARAGASRRRPYLPSGVARTKSQGSGARTEMPRLGSRDKHAPVDYPCTVLVFKAFPTGVFPRLARGPASAELQHTQRFAYGSCTAKVTSCRMGHCCHR